MKNLIYSVATFLGIACGTFAGYWVGTQSWEGGTHFSTEEARQGERRLASATIDALHVLFRHDPDYWFNEFVYTQEYARMDSIREGDWEDFYAP